MRSVLYSLSHRPAEPHAAQLIESVRSLRRHNGSIRVRVVLYGTTPDSVLAELSRLEVETVLRPTFAAALCERRPRTWNALAHYPGLHKWLSLEAIAPEAGERVLYLDTDTFLVGDVAVIIDAAIESDWYAREEPYSGRSSREALEPSVNEDLLAVHAESVGGTFVPPYNTGVVQLNHGLATRLASKCDAILDLAWRLLVGLTLDGRVSDRWTEEGRRRVREVLMPSDVARGLVFPSSNHWIVSQVAVWLALATLKPTHSLFGPAVIQNGEFETAGQDWVLCHYFTSERERFLQFASPRALSHAH